MKTVSMTVTEVNGGPSAVERVEGVEVMVEKGAVPGCDKVSVVLRTGNLELTFTPSGDDVRVRRTGEGGGGG
jgi:hypothetical protein